MQHDPNQNASGGAAAASRFDVIIAGAGAAGLSAALVLGRSRRRVLVLDGGAPRNAPAEAAHGVFTRDGTPPLDLLRVAREQLQPYPSIEVRTGEAVGAHGADGDFQVSISTGDVLRARKLILATGVVDELPDQEGFRELWGTGVFHCPYCHGWEVQDQSLAIYGNGASGLDFAILLRGWSRDLVLCTDGPSSLTGEERQRLDQIGIALREERIQRLHREDGRLKAVVFEDGTELVRHGLFLRTRARQRSDLAGRLGCVLNENGFIQVDELGKTSVPGVYAAGDAAGSMQSVLNAAAGGGRAAAGLNHALAHEDAAALWGGGVNH